MEDMARFAKDFLYPGWWTLADGSREYFSADRIAHLANRAKEMLAAGLNIPLSWEHQFKAGVPLSGEEYAKQLAEKTRLICGHVESGDVGNDGILAGEVEVPDPGDAKHAAAIRFCSPYIESDFRDGTGRVWKGESIMHVALTGRPVQHGQKPFVPLSLTRGICLSLDGYRGESAMAEESEEGGEGEGTGDLKALIEALRSTGMTIPDEVSDIAGLIIAVKSAGTVSDDDSGEESDETEVPPPVGGGLAMSMTPAEARVLKRDREQLGIRVAGLFRSGRITKPIHDRLAASLKKVALSLTPDGELSPNAVLSQIEGFEELPPNSAWPATRGEEREVALSLEHRGGMPETDKEIDDAVKAWEAMLPGR